MSFPPRTAAPAARPAVAAPAARPAAPAPRPPPVGGMLSRVGSVAGPTTNGDFWTPGEYIAEITRFAHGTSNKGAGEFVAVEFTVDAILATWGDVAPHRVGAATKHLCMAKTAYDRGLQNLKMIIGAACGMDPNDETIDPNEWTDAATRACEGDGTALAGSFVRVVVKRLKRPGRADFDAADYFPLAEGELEALRAAALAVRAR